MMGGGRENAVLAIMVVARLSGDAAIVNALQCPPGHVVQHCNFIEFGPSCWTLTTLSYFHHKLKFMS